MTQFSLFDDNDHLIFPEGLLNYYPHFLSEAESIELLNRLIDNVPWKQSTLTIQDKVMLTPRLTAWYGDATHSYRLSDKSFEVNPWTESLFELKEKIENLTKFRFNSVLLNYYRDGNDSVAWHSDSEKELEKHPIASLSIGQARTFEFRHKKDHKRKYALTLGNGSLLIMKGDLQQNWDHRIPKSNKFMRPRINLTFRIIN
ncbi:alpha-ketoglutarate-dependent dioxygenase AlkB [Chitinophaga silvatica]|uniref:Alpha-ketoglutarate-dependent dioxygenase AlkB n=1 Tax=Chitinophaga silvatica TaxID=2282649 RepID=A0A3E1YG45_9BACT|nr:alpha-ketoglutarate-dependent dioxygenase AlkB [Chitinophaga silvatica]RFS26354.1 alpha-ketoglutarate-dependent dioxygenase AlkB [Chitinophaga silvatica]